MNIHFRIFGLLFAMGNALLLSAQDSRPPLPVYESVLKELPVLYQQTAAEYRALCYQAYNLARLRLNEIPRRKFRKRHLAIITDIDETVLNNSYLEAQLIKEGKTWSNVAWKNWTSRSMATAVPGAVEFFQYAHSRGAEIYYVSNRDTGDIGHTLVDMRRLNLPNADSAHCLFMSSSSSKDGRRQQVRQKAEVILLLGDNLGDFSGVFDKKTIADRFSETDSARGDWGKRFIVLPNPVYGEWENALYHYDHGLSAGQKEALRLAALQGY